MDDDATQPKMVLVPAADVITLIGVTAYLSAAFFDGVDDIWPPMRKRLLRDLAAHQGVSTASDDEIHAALTDMTMRLRTAIGEKW